MFASTHLSFAVVGINRDGRHCEHISLLRSFRLAPIMSIITRLQCILLEGENPELSSTVLPAPYCHIPYILNKSQGSEIFLTLKWNTHHKFCVQFWNKNENCLSKSDLLQYFIYIMLYNKKLLSIIVTCKNHVKSCCCRPTVTFITGTLNQSVSAPYNVECVLHRRINCLAMYLHVSDNTHTHPFNGPFCGTTRVSQYQKGKTNLDFTEARDSEWQWH